MKIFRHFAAVSLLPALLLCGCSTPQKDSAHYTLHPETFNDTVSGRGIFEPVNETTITVPARIWGTTIKELTDEGTMLKKGDFIAQLDVRRFEESLKWDTQRYNKTLFDQKRTKFANSIKLEEAKLNLEKKENSSALNKQKLAFLRQGTDPRELENAEKSIKKNELQYEYDQKRVDEQNAMAQKGFMSMLDYEKLKFSLQISKIQIEKARNSLQILKESPDENEIKSSETAYKKSLLDLKLFQENSESEKKSMELELKKQDFDIKSTSKKLDMSKTVIEKCTITAPIDGTLLYINTWSGKTRVGMNVWSGSRIARVTDFSALKITGQIKEIDIDRIFEGASVEVTAGGLPETLITGKVTKIDRLAKLRDESDSKGAKEFEITISLDEQNDKLKPNMTAFFKIRSAAHENTFRIPAECVHGKNGEKYVYVYTGQSPEKRSFTPTGKNEDWFYAKTGFSDGDTLLLLHPETETEAQ